MLKQVVPNERLDGYISGGAMRCATFFHAVDFTRKTIRSAHCNTNLFALLSMLATKVPRQSSADYGRADCTLNSTLPTSMYSGRQSRVITPTYVSVVFMDILRTTTGSIIITKLFKMVGIFFFFLTDNVACYFTEKMLLLEVVTGITSIQLWFENLLTSTITNWSETTRFKMVCLVGILKSYE